MPPARGPFEFILDENVAYLADDARRDEAVAICGREPFLVLDSNGPRVLDPSRILKRAPGR